MVGLIIFIAVFVVYIIVGLLKNMILFDSILLALFTVIILDASFEIHTAILITIGVAVLIVAYALQLTKVGFWIIGSLFSLFWSAAIADTVYRKTEKDIIWTVFAFVLSAIIMVTLHIYSFNKNREPDTLKHTNNNNTYGNYDSYIPFTISEEENNK